MEKARYSGFIDFVRKNKTLVVLVVIAALLAYGFEMTQFTVSVDDEAAITDPWGELRARMADGRWGSALVGLLTASIKTLPFRDTAISVILLALAAVWLAKLLCDICENRTAAAAAALVFITLPVHIYKMTFVVDCVEASAAFAALVAAVDYMNRYILFKDERKKNPVAAFLLSLLALSVYQAFAEALLTLILASFMLFILARADELEKPFKSALKYAGIYLSSLAVYFGITALFKLFGGSRAYSGTFIIWSSSTIKEALGRIAHAAFELYMDGLNFAHGAVSLVFILPIAALLIFYGIKFVKKNRLWYYFALAGMLISPMALTVLTSIKNAVRSSQAVAVLIAVLVFAAMCKIKSKWLEYTACAAAAVVVLWQSAGVTELCYGDYLRMKQDERLAAAISQRVDGLGLGEDPDVPVVYVGAHRAEGELLIRDEAFSYSIFEWDGGVDKRMANFMKLCGSDYLTADDYPGGAESAEKRATLMARSMTCWPDEGSVAYFDDMIVVNFGSRDGYIKIENHTEKTEEFEYGEMRMSEGLPEDAAAEMTESGLRVTAMSNDPRVSYEIASHERFDRLYFSITSDTEGEIQIYLADGVGQTGFTQDERYLASFMLYRGENHIYIDAKELCGLTKLRIDPPVGSTVTIEDIATVRVK